jgi:hypothetical protein
VEAVASCHTSRLLEAIGVGGDFLVLREEGIGIKGGAFFERFEVVLEGSSGQHSWSMGVVLRVGEVVHDRDGSQIVYGFEDVVLISDCRVRSSILATVSILALSIF